jgi:hypothetical protein
MLKANMAVKISLSNCSPPVQQGNLTGDFEFRITQLNCHATIRPLTKCMDAQKS